MMETMHNNLGGLMFRILNFNTLAAYGSIAFLLCFTEKTESRTLTDNTEMSAIAYLKDTKKVLYTEQHTLSYDGDKLLTSHTRYFDPNGKLIAQMKSDYRQSLMMPTYTFEDLRRGSTEGLELRDSKYYIFHQNPQEKRQEKLIENPQGIFSCQGWHYYIVKNIEEIQSKDLNLNLLFPSKLDYYSFNLQKESSKDSVLQLRLEFSNWFVRLFAPRLDLTYDASKRKLLSYVGPSNILDLNGDIQYVKVVYN